MQKVKIGGMSCGHCVASVTQALEALAGVKSVQVSLQDKQAEIESEVPIDQDVLRKAIEEIGFSFES